MRITGIPEDEKRKNRTESLFILTVDEHFSNLWKELGPQVQEANRISNYLSPKRPSPRHIVLKLSKINDRKNSQGSQEKGRSYL